MSSQTLVLATAMAVSVTVIFLALSRQKTFQLSQPLRSCLLLKDGKKTERKKKRVRFAENVKDPIGNGEDFRKGQMMKLKKNSVNFDTVCRNEISKPRSGILENRIVSDSVQKAECSY